MLIFLNLFVNMLFKPTFYRHYHWKNNSCIKKLGSCMTWSPINLKPRVSEKHHCGLFLSQMVGSLYPFLANLQWFLIYLFGWFFCFFCIITTIAKLFFKKPSVIYTNSSIFYEISRKSTICFFMGHLKIQVHLL